MKAVDEAEQIAKAEEQIRRAGHAKAAMENPLIKEYFIIARGTLFDRFSKTADHDSNEREHIFLELQQLDRFESNFEKAMLNGKVAQNWLQKLASKTKQAIKR